MVWQSFKSSQSATYQKEHQNGNCHRQLVDQSDNDNRTATYGSGSLDARAIMNNESSVLVANGDSESGLDGIHKINGEDSECDDCFYRCTWKEYFFSWRFVELVLCVVPFTLLWICFESDALTPRHRPMPFQTILNEDGESSNVVWNPVNTEKYLGETIGHREYQVLMGLLPWLLQLTLVWIIEVRKGRNWDAIHRTTCMYFVGIGATDSITNCIKYYVGYFRPIFLDVCEPFYDENSSNFRCSNQSWSATDARMSFPSNHSGWSFCGMMLLSLYLEQNFGLSSLKNPPAKGSKEVLRQRNHEALYRLISMMCYFPLLAAFFVAASRVVDNKHFPADVIGGAVLGGSVATLVFGIWFPQP